MRSVVHSIALLRPRAPLVLPVDDQRRQWRARAAAVTASTALLLVGVTGCQQEVSVPSDPHAPVAVVTHGPATILDVDSAEETLQATPIDNAPIDDIVAHVQPLPAVDVVTTPSPPASAFDQEALFHSEPDVDHVARGNAQLDAGKTAEAVTSFRKALFSDDGAERWSFLAQALLQNGDDERAQRAMRASLAKDGQQPALRQKLVRSYMRSGQVALARMEAETLARKTPNSMPAHYLLGLTYVKSEMWKEAMQSFATVVKAEEDNVFARNNLGFAALQIGANDDAVTALELLVGHKDVRAFMLNNLGVAYEREGRTSEALAAFMRAVELDDAYVNGVLNERRLKKSVDDDTLVAANATLLQMRTPKVKSAVAIAAPATGTAVDNLETIEVHAGDDAPDAHEGDLLGEDGE